MKLAGYTLLLLVQSAFALAGAEASSLHQPQERLAVMQRWGRPVQAAHYIDFAQALASPAGRTMVGRLEAWFEEYLDNEGGKEGYLAFKRETGIEPFRHSHAALIMKNEYRHVAVFEGPFDSLRVNRYFQRLARGTRWKTRQLASALILSNGWLELSLQEAGRLYVSSGGEGVLDGFFRKQGSGSNQDLAAILAHLDYPGQRWSFSTDPDNEANLTLTVNSVRFDKGLTFVTRLVYENIETRTAAEEAVRADLADNQLPLGTAPPEVFLMLDQMGSDARDSWLKSLSGSVKLRQEGAALVFTGRLAPQFFFRPQPDENQSHP